jgi:hypothetical protein
MSVVKAKQAMIAQLLEREHHFMSPASFANMDSSVSSGPNTDPWREKVIGWYFSVVSALDRQQPNIVGANPFNRTSVHVTTALLDKYLQSLPSERSRRYRRDRSAYQLLATTCLLLGMRLAHHDMAKESRQEDEERVVLGEMKRTKTHRDGMDQVDATSGSTNRGTITTADVPNASTILRISAAPKAITEDNILALVREITGSRAFPRCKSITVLDFLRTFSSSSTHACEEDGCSLGPVEAQEAYRLADASLADSSFAGYRPSVVACAIILVVLLRSNTFGLDVSSLRQIVYRSVLGSQIDAEIQAAVRQLEVKLLRSALRPAAASTSRIIVPRAVVSTAAHVIPVETE